MPTTSPSLRSYGQRPQTCRDRLDLKAFRAEEGGRRGARESSATDLDRYLELWEAFRQGCVALVAYREASTGAAMVVCGDGHEVGQGDTMAEALEGLEVAR